VKRKAQQRIEESADRMAKELLGLAIGAASEAVKLAAVKDALDRAGLGAKQAPELSAKPLAPWEEVLRDVAFDGIARITRDEHRSRYGVLPDETPTAPSHEIEVVDVELVPEPGDEDGPKWAVHSPVDELPASDPADVPADEPARTTGHVTPPPPRPLTYEEAAEVMRTSRARSDPGRCPRRRARRPG
jgi:hypothetical protein